MAIVAIGSYRKATYTSSTTSTTTFAPGSTAPSPPSPPTTAPASRSYAWMWPAMIGPLLMIVIVWVVIPALRTSTPPPQATAPKKTSERAIRVPIIGGKTEIRKGEYAEFEFDNSPSRPISRYQIVFQIEGNTPTRHYLKIEDWPETFDYRQTEPKPIIFFDKFGSGRTGEPKFFRPGKVRLKIWSDSDIRILSSHAELIYTG